MRIVHNLHKVRNKVVLKNHGKQGVQNLKAPDNSNDDNEIGGYK